MRNLTKALSLAAGLALVGSTPAWADGFKEWRVCGGDTFMTCAAVQVTVVGQNVTLRIWNLSGNGYATHGAGLSAVNGSIINGIGFYNLPAGVSVATNTLSVSGPVRPGDNPTGWNLRNQGSVAFAVDFRTATSRQNGGIASGCATPSQLPGSPPNLFVNPCQGGLGNNANWVEMTFQINGTWDPSGSAISLKAYNGMTNQGTECWTAPTPVTNKPTNCTTVAPEPVTMTLLATGLAGMGGAGFLRRRKNKNTIA